MIYKNNKRPTIICVIFFLAMASILYSSEVAELKKQKISAVPSTEKWTGVLIDKSTEKNFTVSFPLFGGGSTRKILHTENSSTFEFEVNMKVTETIAGYYWFQGKAIIKGSEVHNHYEEGCEGQCIGKEAESYSRQISPILVSISGEYSDKGNVFYSELHSLPPLNIKYKDSNKIEVEFIESTEGESERRITGELYRITKIRKNFPADIKPNESIKTDEKTQIEITFPDGLKVNVGRNTEVTIEEIKETTLLEVFKGKIHTMIEKLKVKGKFEYHTPTTVIGVRGTEFELNVEDDGTTTLIVLDGKVELSDINKKKTVLVSKNQQVVVKPGELPSVPIQINPDQILNWWE